MRALLTGASSFSGYWFAAKLQAAGFTVVAPLRGTQEAYSEVRGERVKKLGDVAEIVCDCAFGGPVFLELVSTKKFDVLCHHAARVANYRSLDFDIPTALAENTKNVCLMFERMLATASKRSFLPAAYSKPMKAPATRQ